MKIESTSAGWYLVRGMWTDIQEWLDPVRSFLPHTTRSFDTEYDAQNPHIPSDYTAHPTWFRWSSRTWRDRHDCAAADDVQRIPWNIHCQVPPTPPDPLRYVVTSRCRIYSQECRPSPARSSAENRTCLETWKTRRYATGLTHADRSPCAINSPSKQIRRTSSRLLLRHFSLSLIPGHKCWYLTQIQWKTAENTQHLFTSLCQLPIWN